MLFGLPHELGVSWFILDSLQARMGFDELKKQLQGDFEGTLVLDVSTNQGNRAERQASALIVVYFAKYRML